MRHNADFRTLSQTRRRNKSAMRLSLLYAPGVLSQLLHNSPLLLYIFTYLTPNTLCELSCASKFLNVLSSHPVLWSLDKFELKSWISDAEYELLRALRPKDQWRWCFQNFVLGQFAIGLSRNSRVRVPENCILCNKPIKPLVLRWERKRSVRDKRFVAAGAELKNDQEVLYFHWSCVEPPLRFMTHYQVPGYSSLTFEAKQQVREYFEKREKLHEKRKKKQKINSASAIVCDCCDKLVGDNMWQCHPHMDCDLCSKCYRWKSNDIQEEHAKHGSFYKVPTHQSFHCTNCGKTIKDAFFFCKDCPDGHYLCNNCFRRSRTKNHPEEHMFYAIGNAEKSQNSRNTALVIHPDLLPKEEGEVDNQQKTVSPTAANSTTSIPAEAKDENGDAAQAENADATQSEEKANAAAASEKKDETSADTTEATSTTAAEDSNTKTDESLKQEQSTTSTITNSDAMKDDSDSALKRKTLPERSPPARATKRPKKMRLFVQLNKKIREDFALRYFLDRGFDSSKFPDFSDFVQETSVSNETIEGGEEAPANTTTEAQGGSGMATRSSKRKGPSVMNKTSNHAT